MKRLLLLALAALSSVVGAYAQSASLTASSSNYSSAGGTITLTAEINYSTVAFPTALSFNITLPAGWSMHTKSDGSGGANIGGTNVPPVAPVAGQTGSLGFAYGTSGFPLNRASFVVVVAYPASLTGTQTITASALYRTPETTLTVPSLEFTSAADSAPAITTQPISQTVVGGQRVTLIAAASGNPAPTFQWRRNGEGGDITNAIGPTFTIPFVTSASAGSYDVVVTNPSGATATSNAAVLTVASVITGFTPATGGQGSLITINGTGLTGAKAVRFNGIAATTMTVVSATQVTAVVPTFATTGPISVVRADDSVVTSGTSFTVFEDPRLSVVSRVGQVTGTTSIIVGTFTVEGSVAKKILIRGVGPAFGSDPANLSDPFVALVDSAGTVVGSNNEWGTPLNGVTATEVQDAMTAVGASPAYSSTSSKDAALLVTLNPGTYSARVTGFSGTAGTAALQIFDVQDAPRLAYVSNVGQMPAGDGTVSTNFTLTLPSGTGSKALLIRALGAGSLGITGSIANPTLSVSNAGGVIASNDDWGTNTNVSEISFASQLFGAMPLAANDSAVLVTLAAGTYSVTVGKAGSTAGGPVGTEIFVVDSARNQQIAPALIATIPGQTAPFGGSVTFAAPYVGKAHVAFQWKKDGVDIATGTNQLLTLSGASLGAVGSASAYSVVVSNGITPNAVSHGATLAVVKADQSISFASLDPRAFGSGDFNLSATATSGLGVTFASSNSAVATVNGNVVTITGVGDTTITASQTGDTNYNAALPVPQTLTITKGIAGVTLGGLAATFDFNPKPVTVTTNPAGLTVNVTYNGGTTPPNQAGNYEVIATVADANYQGSNTGTLTIAKANQTITFGTLATRTFNDAPFTVTATTNSTHTVQFVSSNPGVATVSASTLTSGVASATVTIFGAGSTIITASEPGGANFNAATPVPQTLTVDKLTVPVALSNLSATFDGTPKNVAVNTTPGGLNVTFTYNGSSTVPIGAGSYTVVGTVNEANYQGSDTKTLVIAKAPQTITFGTLLSKPFNDPNFMLTAVSRDSANQPTGLAITYTSSDTAIADIVNGNEVDLKNKGSTIITASQPGSDNYLPATPVPQALDVLNAGQAITFAALPTKTFGDGTMNLTAESRATLDNAATGLTVAFASSNTTVATISGNVLTIVGGGTSIITATQPGNDNFAAATPVPQTLTVNKAAGNIVLGGLAQAYTGTARTATATTTPSGLTVDFTYDGGATAPINVGTYVVVGTINSQNYSGSANGNLVISKAEQTITFAGTELASKTFGDVPFTIAATSDSTLAVSFTSSDPTVASVSGNTITIHTGGITTITATQIGNDNYNAAPPVALPLAVAKAAATVTLTDLTHTYNGSPKGAGGTTAPLAGLLLSFNYTTGPAGTAPISAGSYGVTATIVDARYQGFATGTITINKAPQTIDFAGLPSKPFNDPDFPLTAVSRDSNNQPTGLPISYVSSDPTVATVTGNIVHMIKTGTTTFTASQLGDDNYLPATSVPQLLTVLNAGQTITFAGAELAGKTFGDADITLFAESRATVGNAPTGLTVAFASDNAAVATIVGNTLTIVGAGTANITASQAGDSKFASANPVPRLLTVAPKAATVTLGSLAQVYNNTPRSATAVTVPAGLNVAFTYTPTGGTASPIAPTAAGSYSVTGMIAGATPPESNYVGSATGTLVIAKATQTISFADILSPKLVNAGSFSLTATSDATPTLAVTFTSSNPAVASISGNVVTIHALGTTTITAKQAGDTNYLPAVDFPQTLVVNPVAPVITSHPALAQTAVVGSQFIFGPVTLNALSAPTIFSIAGAPAGLSVNPTTGIISGVSSGTPGTFNIVLTATNATASDSKTIVLTLQPPAPVITSAAAVAVVAGNAIDYTVTTTPTLSNGVTLSTSTLPAWLSFNAATGAFSGTPTVPESITVTVTATNATGAAVLPLQIAVTPNPNAPIYTGTSTPSGSAGAAFSFVTNFGSGAGTTTYVLTGPAGMVINAAGVISWPTPVPGTHPVTIVATRGGLSTTAMLHVTINPAANAPVVSITGGNVRSATVGSVFGPIAMTATSLPTSFTIGTLPAGLTVGGTATAPTIGGTPTTPGTTNVAITATNSAGTGPAAILTITVAPHAQAPIITSSPIVQGRVGEALSYTLTATPVIATTYGSTGTLPPGTSLTAGVVGGTPTAAGSYTAFFAGTNTNGIGLALQVTFNIAPPLTVPVVTSNGSAPAQVGQSFSYAITATNSPTSFGATPLPAGLSLNAATGMITGVPSTATSPTTPAVVSLTATKRDGTSNPKPLHISIAPAPAAPVVTSGATANGRVGLAFTYQIAASGTPTSFVATDLPAGLTLAPATGAITGTPTVAGTFAATIAAANTSGLGANAPLTLTIAPALTAPAITSAATAAGQVGVACTYQISASPGTISSYALTGTLPTGLALNTSTGAITGSPTVPGSVTVSLTATSDGGTSLPQPLTLQIAPAANVPVITSPGSATANVGAAFSYQITSTPAATTLDAANLPSGLAVNPFTGLITGTPTTVCTTIAGLVGTNAAGTGPTRDLSVTVQPAATAPVVTGATSLSAQVGVNFTHQMTATNGPTSFEVIGAPAWMTVNSATGVIAGTPTTPGSLIVFFLAGNSAGMSSPRIVTFNFAAAPNTPLITSSHTAAGTVGAAFSGYTLTATNTPTGYLALGLPPGLTLNPTTGAITGTPTSSGTYPVTVSASNATGPGTPITVTFTIARSVSFGL